MQRCMVPLEGMVPLMGIRWGILSDQGGVPEEVMMS